MTDYSLLFDYVRAATGLTFPDSRLASVRAVFADAMTARGVKSAGALVQAMQADAALRDAIVARLTVGETYFFRDPAQFAVVRNTVIPDILASKPAEARSGCGAQPVRRVKRPLLSRFCSRKWDFPRVAK